MENFINSLPDLDTAQESKNEYNPVAFNAADYPEMHEMLYSAEFNSDEVHTIDTTALSKNGILLRDPMQKYLDKRSNGSSALKELLKTPFHYAFHIEQKQKADPKDHFELGTFAHMAFLEPELFDKVIIQPDHPLNTKEGVFNMVRWFEKINQEPAAECEEMKMQDLRAYLEALRHRCKYQLISKDHQIIIDAIRFGYTTYGGGIIKRILKGATSEVSFYGTDESTGLPVKIRPDFFNIKENIGVDAIISFKTTSAQSLGKMLYDSAKFQYELSEGMYQEVASEITGRKFNVTIMIMLQTVPPYLPVVFWWSPEDLANGKYKYHYALDTLKDCREKQSFPGFDASAEAGTYGLIDMHQPEWSQKVLHPVDIDE